MQVFDDLVDGVAARTTAQALVGVVVLNETRGFIIKCPADELGIDASY